MKKYKVTLTRHNPPNRSPMFNPFMVRDITRPAYNSITTIRTWEFEAKNEQEVRKFYEEAQAKRLPNVDGFTLANIEEIKP